MKKKFSLKEYIRSKNFSVLLVPDSPEKKAKTVRITLIRLLLIVFIYTAIAAFAGFFFFYNTMGELFITNTGLTEEDKATVIELNEKLDNVSRELDELRRNNTNLKKAIDIVDSSALKPETKPERKKPNRRGGSLYQIIRYLVEKRDTVRTDPIYFRRPVNGFISREFNPEKGHLGIDYVVKKGTPIYAAANGYVIFADYTVKDGYMIILNHGGEYSTVYKHCSVLVKKLRERVVEGELIALSGNSGEITTGPHLHFEIIKQGKPVDPKKYILNIINGERDENKK
jgi:murein DD-endopeptidase MepM/ murein hydrolase activator NlpD